MMERILHPLKIRILTMIGKAMIDEVKDSTRVQLVKAKIMGNNLTGWIERIQQAGFTSVPVKDGEAIAVCIGGDQSNMVIIATDAAATRPNNLAEGDVCVYHIKHPDKKVWISANGVAVYGKLTVNGDIEATGDIYGPTVHADGSLPGTKVGLGTHVHLCATPGTPSDVPKELP